MYCCKEFEIKAEAHDGFFKWEDGTWGIWGCLIYMKCCPFCGAALGFTIEESNLFGWYVWDKDKVLAHFEFKYEARGYIDEILLQ